MNRISAQELAEWEAYLLLQPQGFYMDEFHHGSLMSLIANVNRDPKTTPNPFKPEDFMYSYQPSSTVPNELEEDIDDIEIKSEEEWKRQKNIALMWTSVLGGKVIRKQ